MPCTDGGVPYEEDLREARESLMTKAALCALLSLLESEISDPFTDLNPKLKSPLDLINYKEAGIKRKDLEKWWTEHKAQDAARRSREALEQREELERQAAKRKLTKREKNLLGIK